MGKFLRPELDPEKISLWWPPVNGDKLTTKESWYIDTICFTITEEKTNKIMELFKIITMDPALKHWGLKQ